MTAPEQILAFIDAAMEDEAIPLEPREEYDQFVVGIAKRGPETVLVYDTKAIIAYHAALAPGEAEDDDQDAVEAAMEHLTQNLSLGGDGMPFFVLLIEPDAD